MRIQYGGSVARNAQHFERYAVRWPSMRGDMWLPRVRGLVCLSKPGTVVTCFLQMRLDQRAKQIIDASASWRFISPLDMEGFGGNQPCVVDAVVGEVVEILNRIDPDPNLDHRLSG